MLRKKAPPLIFMLVQIGVSTVFAAPFDDFKFSTPNRIDFTFETKYYKPDANFDKSGNTYTKVVSGNTYELFDFDLGARARLSPNWHVYGGGEFASGNSFNALPNVKKSNSGLSQMVLGTDYLLIAGGILLVPDFSLTIPMTTVDRASTDIAVTEGVMEMNGRLVARIERRTWRFGGFVGVDYRDKGRSMLIPYGFLTEFTFGKWNLGADLRGYQSASNDKDTNSEPTLDATYFCQGNGCYKKFAAINPSLLQTDFWVRGNISPQFALFGGAAYDITGSNIAKGFGVSAGIIYRWPISRSSEPAPRSDFEEILDDGVDQRAFQGGRSMTPSVVPSRGPRPQQPPRPNLQDELNKTEMQIETKPVRPEGE